MNRHWTKPQDMLPPKGTLVETMNSTGQVQDLVFMSNLWFHPDRTTYVYYVPRFWRFKQ